MLEKLFSILVGLLQDFRRVRFRTHLASFVVSGEVNIFLTVTNLSRNRDIEITHVWLALSPQVAAMPSERPLPKRLKPDEVWETWIPLSLVPSQSMSQVENLGRLRLSTGRVVKARPDSDVPAAGSVPGKGGNEP